MMYLWVFAFASHIVSKVRCFLSEQAATCNWFVQKPAKRIIFKSTQRGLLVVRSSGSPCFASLGKDELQGGHVVLIILISMWNSRSACSTHNIEWFKTGKTLHEKLVKRASHRGAFLLNDRDQEVVKKKKRITQTTCM